MIIEIQNALSNTNISREDKEFVLGEVRKRDALLKECKTYINAEIDYGQSAWTHVNGKRVHRATLLSKINKVIEK